MQFLLEKQDFSLSSKTCFCAKSHKSYTCTPSPYAYSYNPSIKKEKKKGKKKTHQKERIKHSIFVFLAHSQHLFPFD